MIVCFLALAGIYVPMGAPLLGVAQVIIYIGAISVLILFAIMLTQTKDAPTRLVFQTQAGAGVDRRDRHRGRHRSPSRRGARSGEVAPRGGRVDTDDMARVLFQRVRPPVRDRQRAAARRVIGGVFLAKREPGGPSSDSLDTYLILSGSCSPIGSFGFLARRNAISMLMSIELMLNAVNLAIVAFGRSARAPTRTGRDRSSP